MSTLSMCRHALLDGQEEKRSFQTVHFATEAQVFDHQVASWLFPTLPLRSSIRPWSIAPQPLWSAAHILWFAAHSGWSIAHFGWSVATP